MHLTLNLKNNCHQHRNARSASGETVMESVDGVMRSVNAFMLANSWGAVNFSWTFMPTLIEGTESCSGTSSPNAGNLATEAYAGALAGGYNSSGYDYFMVYFPYCSNIGWAGLADVGGTRTWINGHEMPAYVLSHELGHNFGAYHANWGSSGSPYSLMGNGPLPEGHFNVAGKEVFDWVPHDAIAHIPRLSTYSGESRCSTIGMLCL